MIDYFIKNNYKIITVEDNYIIGGFGAYVLNYINEKNKNIQILNLGYKDEFVTHGQVEILYKLNKLDEDGIFKSIVRFV
jgi:1-deoxy-D-xylulose-5-phosphate synthase